MVKLGWWLKGNCDCSDDAICTEIVSPVDGSAGYRCQCKDGFVGDGYSANNGCQKGKQLVFFWDKLNTTFVPYI